MTSPLLLSFVAGGMVAAIVAVLIMAANARTYTRMFFVYFALGMMILMLSGAALYLYYPSEETLGIAFGVNMVYMLGVLAYYFIIAEEVSGRELSNFGLHSVLIGVLVVVNEALMGATFTLAQYGRGPFSTPLASLYNSINSYWFFYPMMAEMLGLFLYHLSRGYLLKSLFPLVEMTAFPPTLFSPFNLVLASSGLSVASSLLGIYYSGDSVLKAAYGILAVVSAAALVTPYPYDAAVVASMALYFYKAMSLENRTMS